jgi:hypothetical protein
VARWRSGVSERSAGLLVVGVRAVHGWTWGRAAAACALALVAPVVLALVLSSL